MYAKLAFVLLPLLAFTTANPIPSNSRVVYHTGVHDRYLPNKHTSPMETIEEGNDRNGPPRSSSIRPGSVSRDSELFHGSSIDWRNADANVSELPGN